MKKYITLFLFIVFSTVNIFSDIDLGNIDSIYHGIWIPEEFLKTFKEYANYSMAMQTNNENEAHDILIVGEKHIFSDVGFHDRYAINTNEFEKFRLFKIGNVPHIIDDHENDYYKIGIGDKTNYQIILSTFLLSVIKEKLNKINPDLAIDIVDNELFLLPSRHKIGPYSIVLDLFMMGRLQFELTDYNFFISSRERRQMLGIKFDVNKIIIDQIIQQQKLKSTGIKSVSISSINIYEME